MEGIVLMEQWLCIKQRRTLDERQMNLSKETGCNKFFVLRYNYQKSSFMT